MPLPVGVSVAIMSRSKALCRWPARAQQRGAQIARGADLQCDFALEDDAFEVRVRHRRRPAVDVERHMRL